MKRLIFVLCFLSASAFSQHRISLKINGLRDSTCYLIHAYLNEKLYTFQDTAKADAYGKIVFEGKKILPEGFYAVARGKTKLFDLVLTDQRFSIETDTSNYVGNMKIKGSKEANLFLDFLKTYDKKREDLKKADNETKNKIYAELEQFKQNLIKTHEGTFTSNFLKATTMIELPKLPKNATQKDSSELTNYYFNHYWDNVALGDERMIRTPLLDDKMDYYLKNITYYEPDTISMMVDKIIDKTPEKTSIRRYFVTKIGNKFIQPDILGRDKVYIHIAEKYIIQQPESFDSSTVAININYVRKMKPLLIGEKIPNMFCTDTLDNLKPLYDIAAPYTLLMIYDPHCPHCQETTKKLTETYSDLAGKGLKVYLCCGTRNKDEWRKFIKEYKTQQFVNVYDSKQITDFENTFNVSMFPTMFVLDKNKKIMANRKMDVTDISRMISLDSQK